jgi:hypothetical protein
MSAFKGMAAPSTCRRSPDKGGADGDARLVHIHTLLPPDRAQDSTACSPGFGSAEPVQKYI